MAPFLADLHEEERVLADFAQLEAKLERPGGFAAAAAAAAAAGSGSAARDDAEEKGLGARPGAAAAATAAAAGATAGAAAGGGGGAGAGGGGGPLAAGGPPLPLPGGFLSQSLLASLGGGGGESHGPFVTLAFHALRAIEDTTSSLLTHAHNGALWYVRACMRLRAYVCMHPCIAACMAFAAHLSRDGCSGSGDICVWNALEHTQTHSDTCAHASTTIVAITFHHRRRISIVVVATN